MPVAAAMPIVLRPEQDQPAAMLIHALRLSPVMMVMPMPAAVAMPIAVMLAQEAPVVML